MSKLILAVYKDDAKEWRWRLRAANGRIVADSGEGYKNKGDCLKGLEMVRNSQDATIAKVK